MGISATPLTESSTFTASIYPPQAGTLVSGADVETGEQALGNRTTYLKSKLDALTVGAFTYDLGLGNFAAAITSTTFVDAGSILVDMSSCQIGDKLLIDFSGHLQLTLTPGNTATCKLVSVEDSGGTPTTSDVPGTTRLLTADDPTVNRVSMTGLITIADAGTCRIKLQAKVTTTGNFDVEGWAVLRVMRIRP